MPIKFNASFDGDNFFGDQTKFDPLAFKTSAERQNIDRVVGVPQW